MLRRWGVLALLLVVASCTVPTVIVLASAPVLLPPLHILRIRCNPYSPPSQRPCPTLRKPSACDQGDLSSRSGKTLAEQYTVDGIL